MVDTNEYLEGQYITVDMVKNSPSRRLVVIGEPKGEETDFGKKLTANVKIDQKQKIWRLNKDSIKNMQELGRDSKTWNGAVVDLRIITTTGKECVVGIPQIHRIEEVKEIKQS
jgi:hypothetical protein